MSLEVDDLVPNLVVERVPIDSLTPDPGNAMAHPPRNRTAIKGSLARFRQQKPVIVDRARRIIAGEGTWRQLKELGATHINIIVSDLDGLERDAYSIADNQTARLADWNREALGMRLHQLADEEFDLSTTGFSDAEIEKALAAAVKLEPEEGEGAGGDPFDEDLNPGEVGPRDSDVRMLQLYLTHATYDTFLNRVTRLAEVFGTTNPTDTVWSIVEELYRQRQHEHPEWSDDDDGDRDPEKEAL